MVRQTAIKEIAREWAREYEAASESLDAIPEDYAMSEVDALKVNAIIFDTHKALEGADSPFKGFYAKSVVGN